MRGSPTSFSQRDRVRGPAGWLCTRSRASTLYLCAGRLFAAAAAAGYVFVSARASKKRSQEVIAFMISYRSGLCSRLDS